MNDEDDALFNTLSSSIGSRHSLFYLFGLTVWANRPQEQIEIGTDITNSQYNNGCRRSLYYRISFIASFDILNAARNIEGVELGLNAKQVY